MDGGFSAIDYALRMEVKAVDALGFAALANAGMRTLDVEIERELLDPTYPPAAGRDVLPPAAVRAGEKFYSTGEVAEFFGKSVQWVYWAMRTGVFTQPDGAPIEPMRVGKNGRRRFSVPVLRDMAHRCPETLGEMGTIPGVGAKKLETWGPDFVAVVREHLKA